MRWPWVRRARLDRAERQLETVARAWCRERRARRNLAANVEAAGVGVELDEAPDCRRRERRTQERRQQR